MQAFCTQWTDLSCGNEKKGPLGSKRGQTDSHSTTLQPTQGRARENSLKLGQGSKGTRELGNSINKSHSGCEWVSTRPDHSWRTSSYPSRESQEYKLISLAPSYQGGKTGALSLSIYIMGCGYVDEPLLQSA